MSDQVELQPHQEKAIDKFEKSNSLIAFHGLGSGKTLTAIEAGNKTPGTKLVITPAALIDNFKKEFKKFNLSDKKYRYVSYETFRRNPDSYINKYKPEMIIADEFHRSKNPDTLTGDSLREARLKVHKFLGLTGSISQNYPTEIADLVNTASGHNILGTDKEFKNQYIKTKTVKGGLISRVLGVKPGQIEEAKNLSDFKNRVEPYVDTFAGDKEYLKHIPTVEKEIRRIPMSDSQQKVYNYTFKNAPFWVRWKIKHNLPPSKKESKNLNAFLIGARQASNSTYPFGVKEDTPKIKAIVHDIREGLKSNPKFKSVVYSNFLGAGLNPIEHDLKKYKIPYGSFTGAQSESERNETVRQYNKGNLRALLVSPAGGEGLDLKNTNLMAITDSSWNPERLNQAIGRVARYKSHESLPIDQRKVKVIEYLSEPKLGLLGKIKKFFKPTFHNIGTDEYIYNRSQDKQKLNDQFTNALKEVK